MSLFVDKHNRRKSPIAVAAFGAALLDLCVFGAAYALLAGPLYRTVVLASPAATVAVHAVVIAAVGTAVCCLLFLLKDKRVVPYGFAGLAVALCMFYAAAMLLDEDVRGNMLALISMYGLAPVLLGNAVAWPIYLHMKRRNPALNHRKTIREELQEAVEKDAARQEKRRKKHPEPPAPETAPQTAPEASQTAPAAPETPPEAPAEPELTPEEAMFGPEAGGPPAAYRSAQEEAMLLFTDDDEESDD